MLPSFAAEPIQQLHEVAFSWCQKPEEKLSLYRFSCYSLYTYHGRLF